MRLLSYALAASAVVLPLFVRPAQVPTDQAKLARQAHAVLQKHCAQCHAGGKFAGTPMDCVGCHLSDFQKATNPNHTAAGFPTACVTCHTTTQWMGAKFDHNTATKFALTGTHVTTACSQCHANNRFAGTPMDCVGCHLTDYQKAMNPNHTAAGFPTTCR